jgi:hypothetical protein
MAVSLFFVLVSNSMTVLDYLSTYATIFGIVTASAFITYVFFYLYGIRTKKDYSRVLDLAFLISLIDFFAMFFFSGPASKLIRLYNTSILYPLLVYAVTVVMAAFTLFLFVYFFRKLRLPPKRRILVIVCIFVAISLMLYFIIIGTLGSQYKVDDEVYISVKGIGYLLSGINPYQHSLAQQLYYNASDVGFTVTATNQIIGVLGYPALYLFAYLPFVLITQPTVRSIGNFLLPLQDAVFFTILLLAIAFSVDKESIRSPPYGILLSLAFISLLKASMVNYLIVALLVLAYAGMGKRYSWVLLGLCLSIQELAWLPVILLLAHSFNNYGIRKGIEDTVGSALVFLAINGYFIMLSPSAFFEGIFNPLQKLLLPLATSSLFGFFILTVYHTLLSTSTMIFGIVALLMVVAYVYTNEKVLLGLFSMIPMFFLTHALASYYVVFLVLIFVTMLIKEKKHGSGVIGGYLRKRKLALVLLVSALLLAFVVTVYLSHVSYIRNFDLSISNQSMHYGMSPNETLYTGTLSYSDLSVNSVYLLFDGYGSNRVGELGIPNYSIIDDPVECSPEDFQCLVNVNRITLANGTGTYQIRIYIPRTNATETIVDARLMLYNGKYFYIAPAVFDTNALDT